MYAIDRDSYSVIPLRVSRVLCGYIKGNCHPFLTYPLYVPQYEYIKWVPVLELKVDSDLSFLPIDYKLTKIITKSRGDAGEEQTRNVLLGAALVH